MKSNSRITRGLRLALLFAASACGDNTPAEETREPAPVQPQQPALVEAQNLAPVDPVALQEPLLTLKGTLTLDPSVTLYRPVRLALAWYPCLLDCPYKPKWISAPLTIATEEVVFQGNFPADFQFRVYQPPPDEALSAPFEPDLTTRGAIGVLLAYQDVNGNGKLDTIPINGSPIDRILGTSIPYLDDASPAYTILYLDSDLEDAPSFKKGFNLWDKRNDDNGPMPLSTSIPMRITKGGSFFDVFVCEGVWPESGPRPSPRQCGLNLSY
ncbi:hypothetical protein [Archangium lipolyticum]|uniref:hypothetical protein n=1 Tax=Archangium lipolyticum TaxID=2970465 RepID=UPI00214A9F9B|nr:hypothetical protein [Archangium lipolyticum]